MNDRSKTDHLTRHYALRITHTFLTFRLVYIPASILSHSGHTSIWLNALLGITFTFGGEWLARRRRQPLGSARQSLVIVLLALLLVGFFPEEGPMGLILWTGIGLAWGDWARGRSPVPQSSADLAVLLIGPLLGLTGLLGPGSWIMALLLLPLLIIDARSAADGRR